MKQTTNRLTLAEIMTIAATIANIAFLIYCLLLITFVLTMLMIDTYSVGYWEHKDAHVQKSAEEQNNPPSDNTGGNGNGNRNDVPIENGYKHIPCPFPTHANLFFLRFPGFGEMVVPVFRESYKDPPIAGVVCLQQSVVPYLSDMFIQNFRINVMIFFRQL